MSVAAEGAQARPGEPLPLANEEILIEIKNLKTHKRVEIKIMIEYPKDEDPEQQGAPGGGGDDDDEVRQ